MIIGDGRVGGALARRHAQRLADAHGPIALLRRADDPRDALTDAPGRPIIVAVRNDDLSGVLERIPAARRDDLVLIQNGMLRPWIATNALEPTRGLLFFAVPRRGAEPEPGGDSPFVGRHAALVAAWLSALGLPASEVDAQAFAELELEKLIWNSAFGLLCERHAAPVGVIVDQHRDDLRALVHEFTAIGRPALGLPPVGASALAALVESLCAYSRSIASYRGAVKEWRWRNGWFVDEARRRGVATPVHDDLLARTGHPKRDA